MTAVNAGQAHPKGGTGALPPFAGPIRQKIFYDESAFAPLKRAAAAKASHLTVFAGGQRELVSGLGNMLGRALVEELSAFAARSGPAPRSRHERVRSAAATASRRLDDR